uniref:Uncharacterized protein n=1 Tax=Hypsiglena sp. JMG-2014 TaxID=1550645 RepID=A0A098LZ24_9SAUR
MASIVPWTASPGSGVFVTRHGAFVVRSDLGYFLQTLDFSSGQDLKIQPLHPACRGKDHYVGDPSSLIVYLLHGDSFCQVSDLNSEPPSDVFPLHPSCRGADQYAFCEGCFFIFFLSRAVVLCVADLATGALIKEIHLEPTLLNGLFYYGSDSAHLACFRMDEEQRLCGTRFATRAGHKEESFAIHPDVVSFLPGGLSITHGAAFGQWQCLKLLSNPTDLPMPSSNEISRKVGYSKLELGLKAHVDKSVNPESLAMSLLQHHFALPTIYGGLGLQTEQEEWEEAAEEEEPLRVILQPRQKLYWWHYCLGLGKTPILYCRSLKITRNPSPPTNIPLPRTEV